jgi:kinesin family protein 11
MKDIEIQMRALDDFVTRARSRNAQHHDVHSQSLKSLSETAKASYDRISSELATNHEHSKSLGDDISEKQKQLDEVLATLDYTLQKPLSDLRANISRTNLQEYEPTGQTPQRTQYKYPTELPRTEPHENLLAATGSLSPLATSPSKSAVFSDPLPDAHGESVEPRSLPTFSANIPPSKFSQTMPGLREININVLGISRNSTPEAGVPNLSASVCADHTVPLLGRSAREPSSRKPVKKPTVVALEGRENALPSQVQALSRSTGRRRSPRIVG